MIERDQLYSDSLRLALLRWHWGTLNAVRCYTVHGSWVADFGGVHLAQMHGEGACHQKGPGVKDSSTRVLEGRECASVHPWGLAGLARPQKGSGIASTTGVREVHAHVPKELLN